MIASLRARLAACMLCLLLASALPAQAQEQEARVLFDRGNRHLSAAMRLRGARRTQELEQAMEAYAACLRIVRSRNVLFNAAITLGELDRPDESFNYFVEYASMPDLTAEERAEGQRRIEALRPRIAILRIESVPDGAEVRIDRRDLTRRGLTPLELAVPAGEHRVLLSREGFEDAQAPATARAGASELVRVELSPMPVPVQVIASDRGTLTLDGERIESGRSIPVRPGQHVLRLEIEGAPVVERRFEVRAGSEAMVLELAAPILQGTHLSVLADSESAVVFVDGVEVGRGRSVLAPIAPGDHQVRVEATGHHTLEQQVRLLPERTLRMDVDLGVVPDATGVNLARGLLGGGAAVGLAIASLFGARALQLHDQWQRDLAANDRNPTSQGAAALERLAAELRDASAITDVAFVVAAALGTAAIVSLLVDPGSPEESRAQIALGLGPGSLALRVGMP